MGTESKARQEAIRLAKEETQRSGRKYVAREDFGRYHVVPLYRLGQEGREHDAGYSAFGSIVGESL